MTFKTFTPVDLNWPGAVWQIRLVTQDLTTPNAIQTLKEKSN